MYTEPDSTVVDRPRLLVTVSTTRRREFVGRAAKEAASTVQMPKPVEERIEVEAYVLGYEFRSSKLEGEQARRDQ